MTAPTGDQPYEPDPLTDRRQRAREAAYDPVYVSSSAFTSTTVSGMLDEAIETATRVRIDRDMLADFARAWHEAPQDGPPGTRRRAGLAAAFRRAGFEVEEEALPPVSLAIRKHSGLCQGTVCFEDDFTDKCTCWCHSPEE